MTLQLISIYALAAMFVVATIWPVNMGVLAFVGAFLVGTLGAGMSTKEIVAGFPSGLFLMLTGITYLFAIAQTNGTIDWLVRLAVRGMRGRVSAIPWVMFLTAAAITGFGAASPAAVAIVAPIALGFAHRHGINPLMIGLLVIHGAQAGGFSPISIYGGITNSIVTKAGLPVNELFTFLASLGMNIAAAVLLSIVMKSRKVPSANPCVPDERASETSDDMTEVAAAGPSLHQVATLAGLITLAVLVVGWNLDIGFVAITIGLVLSLIAPQQQQKGAIAKVSWPEILLVTGMGTYVAVLEKMGTIDFVGHGVASLSSPLLAALLLCFIGATVSAFASSTAVLGSLIPLAVPFLKADTGIDAIGFIAAMAVASTIVDVSPFSTNGAIVLATSGDGIRDALFRKLLGYSVAVTALAPVIVWLLFIVFR